MFVVNEAIGYRSVSSNPPRRWRRTGLAPRWSLSLLVVAALDMPASAFDPGTTHAGMTGNAALRSRLHAVLREDYGLPNGLFAILARRRQAMSRRLYYLQRQRLLRLDPGGGYRPDEVNGQRAISWLMAGAVLADMPASLDRHHYYCPSQRRGLRDQLPVATTYHASLAALEGGDSLLQLMTRSGFDLTGVAAPKWISTARNPLSLETLRINLSRAITAPTPQRRRHHVAQALLALGAVLSVLQDMAVPNHVRNDYRLGQFQQTGGSAFDRGSRFEQFVAAVFGQFGLPAYRGPAIHFERTTHFFTNKKWQGLADQTAISHFSPGTLPKPLPGGLTDAKRALRIANRSLRFSKPSVNRLSLRCASAGKTCYQRGPHGPLLAYQSDSRGNLRFFLDERCQLATAKHVLPLAAGFSTGFINFMLRARLQLYTADSDLQVRIIGARLSGGRLRIFAEDKRGRRRLLRNEQVSATETAATTLLALPLRGAADAVRYAAILEARDEFGEDFVAAGHSDTEQETTATNDEDTSPLWRESHP